MSFSFHLGSCACHSKNLQSCMPAANENNIFLLKWLSSCCLVTCSNSSSLYYRSSFDTKYAETCLL